MIGSDRPIEIESRDYWFKITSMLQHNWALIDLDVRSVGVIVYFLSDTSGVFDRMTLPTMMDAEEGLRRNGFARFSEDKKAMDFIAVPDPPFWESQNPNGPIYSSGRYWKNA